MVSYVAIASFIVSSVSLFIAICTYKMSLFSQRLQNAQMLVKSFYSSLYENDLNSFRDIIMLRGEPAGGDGNGHYMGRDGKLQNFGEYFSEGAPDSGALERIVYNLNRICLFAKEENINLCFFYSEMGHFIQIRYEILSAMSDASNKNIFYCFKEMKQKYSGIPIKIIGYIE